MVRPFPAHTTERIIIFKPKPPVEILGCIRVCKDPDKKVLLEVQKVRGIYLGYVPVGRSFEVMSVEVKLAVGLNIVMELRDEKSKAFSQGMLKVTVALSSFAGIIMEIEES